MVIRLGRGCRIVPFEFQPLNLNLYTILVQCIYLLLSSLMAPIFSASQLYKDIYTDNHNNNWPITVKGKYRNAVVRCPNPDANEN